MAEASYVSNPNKDTQMQWTHSQEKYAQVAIKKAENKRFFLQQPYFEEGEGTGHILASVVKTQRPSSLIFFNKGIPHPL